jgi:transcriptional repressor NrdR
VIDSRDVNDGIRRRRECLQCSARFTTYERIQITGLYIIKKDKRREEFNKEKLLTGIRKACEKRPLPTGTVDRIADDIEAELYKSGKSEVASGVIGDMVMERLKKVDHIAYIRFASVYRDFRDITDFKEAVDNLVNGHAEPAHSISQLPLLPEDKPRRLVGAGRRPRSR